MATIADRLLDLYDINGKRNEHASGITKLGPWYRNRSDEGAVDTIHLVESKRNTNTDQQTEGDVNIKVILLYFCQ